jgi:hypothetical protein
MGHGVDVKKIVPRLFDVIITKLHAWHGMGHTKNVTIDKCVK